MVKYIAKANNDVLSNCACKDALAAGPAQLDCPWCGCGWLLSCSKCRKAFTYGRIVEVERSYEDFVREDFQTHGGGSTPEDIREGAEWMAEALSAFAVGDVVVYLDGVYLPLDATNFAFDGWFAQHDFDRLPHAVALTQPEALRNTLGDQAYWLERELVDGDPEDGDAEDGDDED